MKDAKPFLRHALSAVLLMIACVIAQLTLARFLALGAVMPNLCLIVAASYGLIQGRSEGMIIGFCCGLLLDLFDVSMFGTNAVCYMLVGLLNGSLRRLFYGNESLLPLGVIGLTDLIYGLLTWLFRFALSDRGSLPFYFLNIMMPEAVYTLLVSVFLYYGILRLNRWAGWEALPRGAEE